MICGEMLSLLTANGRWPTVTWSELACRPRLEQLS